MSLVNTRNAGFTLIELMLGLLLGLIVLGGVLGVFVTTYQSSSQDIKRIRLNEEMRAVMEMMSRDMRRAGSWQSAARTLAVTPTSINNFANDLNWVVTRFGSEASKSCVSFAYDSDGANNVVDPNNGPGSPPAFRRDRFGYRLQAGAVRVRNDGSKQCGDAAGWESITDQEMLQVLNFTVSEVLEPSAPGVPPLRTVVVRLRAATNTRGADPTKNAAGAALSAADCLVDVSPNIDIVCRRMEQKVRVRNDVPPPP